MRDDLLESAVRRFNDVVDVYNLHVRNYNNQRVVGFILETVGGANLPSMELNIARAFLKMSRQHVANLDNPTQRGIRIATESLRATERQINLVDGRLTQYRYDIVATGENVVTGLQITSTACFTIACVAGGAVLAAPVAAGGLGMSVAGSGAVMGGSTALVSAMSTTTGRALAGEDLDMVDEIVGWGRAGVLGAMGGAAGGAIASKIAGPLAGRLAARLGTSFPGVTNEVLKTTIANALEGGLSNTLQGAIVDTVTAIEGDMTTEQFLENLATNMIAGGISGAVQGRLRTSPGGFRQVAGTGADQAVLW
ncbi:MAG: hypothetical protein WBG57_14230 [Ornithinimicrobium sp.]